MPVSTAVQAKRSGHSRSLKRAKRGHEFALRDDPGVERQAPQLAAPCLFGSFGNSRANKEVRQGGEVGCSADQARRFTAQFDGTLKGAAGQKLGTDG